MTIVATSGPAPAPVRRLHAVLADAREIGRLGGPLVVNNLAIAGMSFADTVMAGWLGPQALGAVAVGFSYYNLFLIVGLGVLMALSPLVAHAYGAGDSQGVGVYARQAVWLVLGLAVPLVAGMLTVRPLLDGLGIDPTIAPTAATYVQVVAIGMPAMLGFLALRFVSEGVGHTRPIMYVALLGLVVNVFGNWVFMYGNLGAPALGAVGTGVSTAITLWVSFFAMLAYVHRHRFYRPFGIFARLERPSARRLREMLALGLPICGSLMSEGGLFVAAALIMGAMSATIVAAHQIALNYAAFMFMVPLALHSATTIHVGHAAGRGDPAAGRRAGYAGVLLCGSLMVVSAIVILLANEGIARLYTRDEAVLELAAGLLLMAAIFQVSDGLQVGFAGALRGFKDARVPMALTVLSYWGVGFPLAFGGGVLAGGGPYYVWWGLIAGLSVAAVALGLRYAWVARRALRGESVAAAAAAPAAAV